MLAQSPDANGRIEPGYTPVAKPPSGSAMGAKAAR